jgi:hypothetical protein
LFWYTDDIHMYIVHDLRKWNIFMCKIYGTKLNLKHWHMETCVENKDNHLIRLFNSRWVFYLFYQHCIRPYGGVFFRSIDNICFGPDNDLQRWNILSNKNSTYRNMKNAFKHNFSLHLVWMCQIRWAFVSVKHHPVRICCLHVFMWSKKHITKLEKWK